MDSEGRPDPGVLIACKGLDARVLASFGPAVLSCGAGGANRGLTCRLLTPLDLAVSKLGRFSDQDRADIAALARRGLVNASDLERRAVEALTHYVGDTQRLRGSIASVVKINSANGPPK
jgi:hypothetical protein